jgi:RIO-like serine/threonine protein kinase
VSKITVLERINLRMSLLDNLYNHHFKAVGEPKMVQKSDLQDNELYLAYKYLTEKKLIEATAISGAGQSSSHRYKITVMGIDYFEKEFLAFDSKAVKKVQTAS